MDRSWNSPLKKTIRRPSFVHFLSNKGEKMKNYQLLTAFLGLILFACLSGVEGT